jgi:hypothetical protein
MIVDDFNFAGVALSPYETDAPLLVYPDAVLALSIPSKQLQPIPGNCLQVRQSRRAVDHREFSHCGTLDALKAQHPLADKQRLRVLRTKGLDHYE